MRAASCRFTAPSLPVAAARLVSTVSRESERPGEHVEPEQRPDRVQRGARHAVEAPLNEHGDPEIDTVRV